MSQDTVGDVMHRGVVTCAPSTSLEEAVRMLSDGDVSALIVVGNAGQLLGTLSHLDVLQHYGENLAERQVGEIMDPGALRVQEDTPLPAAIAMILNSRVLRLVVTTSGSDGVIPVGVISTSDIIRHLRGAAWAWRW